MRMRNYTPFDDEWLRRMIAAVKPPGVSGFDISFKNGEGNRGVAYTKGSSYHTSGRGGVRRSSVPYVVVAVNSKSRFPCTTANYGAYLGITHYTMAELAVSITAHELRHLWQARVARGRRVWGAKGQFSERDADAYALQMLRKYRRGELAI